MLIIAIPKSASTSFLYTVGKIYCKSAEQREFPDLPICSDSRLMHHYHPDIVDFRQEDADGFANSDLIYKQHVFPSAHNLQTLSALPKVVLLREPEEVVLAYRRAEQKGHHHPKSEFANCHSEQDWLRQAEVNGLLQDLRTFYDRWALADNVLLLHYQDLITNTEEVFRKIESFWNLPRASQEISLSKKRYTRYSPRQETTFQVKNAIRRFSQRLGLKHQLKSLQAFLRRNGINVEV